MLNRQLPTALPRAMPGSPFLAAITEVTNSGNEVPMATMVSPTSASLIPRERAMMLALLTTSCPPMMTAASPRMTYTILFGIGMTSIGVSSNRFSIALFTTMKK